MATRNRNLGMGNEKSRGERGKRGEHTERIRWSPFNVYKGSILSIGALINASHLFLRVLSFPVIRWRMSTRSVPQIAFSRQIKTPDDVRRAKIETAQPIRDRLKLHIENCTSNIIVAILRLAKQYRVSVFYAHSFVIVNDIIILLTLTTRPKEERSNAFHCPPERSLTCLDESSWLTRILHGIQDQDHSVIIVKSVECQSEGAGHREERRCYLPSSFSRPCIYHSLFPYIIP